jgi:hypothetical protein
MNNQSESSHISNIDTNISSINSNITNMYSILNIISNTILINQRQTLLNELRTPPPRTNLFSNMSHMSPLFTTPSPIFRSPPTSTQIPSTTTSTQLPSTTSTQIPSIPSTQIPSIPSNPSNTTQIPSIPSNPSNTTQIPNIGQTRSRDSLNSFFSSLFRNEISSGYGIGNMEISLMGLNSPNEEENLVISHHNIFNNTKIKLCTSNEDEEDAIEQCSICLADIEHNQIMREITKCKHIFHVDCADKWFEEHIKCPNCRQDIRIDIVN